MCHRSVFHHHHHQSLNRKGRWGTKDDFTTSFLHCSLFSTALWDLASSRPVHSLMLPSHFFCLPYLLPPFIVSCKMVLARPDEQETCPWNCSLRLFTRRGKREGGRRRENERPTREKVLFAVCLLAFLGLNSYIQPMFGEKVACATVFPHLYVRCHTYKCTVIRHSGSCTPTSEISTLEFVMS